MTSRSRIRKATDQFPVCSFLSLVYYLLGYDSIYALGWFIQKIENMLFS